MTWHYKKNGVRHDNVTEDVSPVWLSAVNCLPPRWCGDRA